MSYRRRNNSKGVNHALLLAKFFTAVGVLNVSKRIVVLLLHPAGVSTSTKSFSCTTELQQLCSSTTPKIFHVTKETEVLAPYGGVSRVVHELATTQFDRFDVFVVLPKYGFINRTRVLCQLSLPLRGSQKLEATVHVTTINMINYIMIGAPSSCPELWSSTLSERMYTVPSVCRLRGFDRQARDLYFSLAAAALLQRVFPLVDGVTNAKTSEHARFLIHVHSSHNAPFVYFAKKSRLAPWGKHVRVIYTLHDYDGEMKTRFKSTEILSTADFLTEYGDVQTNAVDCLRKQQTRFLAKRYLHAFELIMCADVITAVSHGMLTYLKTQEQATDVLIREYVETGRVQVIPNWVSSSTWSDAIVAIDPHDPVKSKMRAKELFFAQLLMTARNTTESCVILWIGRFDSNKGIQSLSTVYSATCQNRCILTIMGYHTSDTKDKRVLQRQITDIRRSRYAVECPMVLLDDPAMQDNFGLLARAAADAVIITSVQEAYGLVAAESLAFASVPIVPSVGGLVDFVCSHRKSTHVCNWTGIVYDRSANDEIMSKEIQYAISHCLELLDAAQARMNAYTELLQRLQESTPTRAKGRQAYDEVVNRLLLSPRT